MRIIDRFEAQQLFFKRKVNIVSGSFDLIHAGHIHFLKQAKLKSKNIPLLVIILNDDDIRIRKGALRPIYKLADRLTILQSISYIDYILPWQDNWRELRNFVKTIKINYLFATNKDPGLDNKKAIASESSFRIKILNQYNQVSTTSIIKCIIHNAKKS